MTPFRLLFSSSLAIAILLFSHSTSAQQHFKFQSDEALKELYLDRVEEVNDEFKKNYSGEYDKEFKEFFKKRAEDAELLVEEDVYLFDSISLAYLNGLKGQIAEANSVFDFSNISLVLAQYPWPNAYSTGDGTIAVIPELVTYYDSEDQFIFILCHEFAHYFAQHSERQVESHYKRINSEEFKAKKKDAEKAKYGGNTKLTALLNENLYSIKEHSREFEREADSLGLVLYRNTTRCLKNAYKSIGQLENTGKLYNPADSLIYHKLPLPTVQAPKSTMIKIDDKDRDWKWDKVKSHPDVPERVVWLKGKVESEGYISACDSVSNTEFDSFKRRMDLLSCDVLVTYGLMDAALVRAERLKTKYPDSDFLRARAGYSMYSLYYGRKHHELSNYSRDLTDDIEDPDLKNLLTSVNHSRLGKLKKSTYDYLRSNYTKSQTDKRFLVAYARMIKEVNAEDETTFNELKEKYLTHYPKGEYSKNFPYDKKR